jgi:hypothetical protein
MKDAAYYREWRRRQKEKKSQPQPGTPALAQPTAAQAQPEAERAEIDGQKTLTVAEVVRRRQAAAQPSATTPAPVAQPGRVQSVQNVQYEMNDGVSAVGKVAPARGGASVVAPCTEEAFDRICIRLARGDTWRAIREAEGLTCWAEVSERGLMPENVERWKRAQAAAAEADRAELRDTGKTLLATARAELPSREETGDNDGRKFSRRTMERAASTALAGAGLLDPATHGRGAGRQGNDHGAGGGQVIVNVIVAPQPVLMPASGSGSVRIASRTDERTVEALPYSV